MLAASPDHDTSSGHIRGYGDGPTRDNGLSQLISVYYYTNLNLIGQLQRLRPKMISLHTIWRPNVVLAASPDHTSSGHIRGYGDGPTQDNRLSQLISVSYYTNLN